MLVVMMTYQRLLPFLPLVAEIGQICSTEATMYLIFHNLFPMSQSPIV